MVHTVNVCTSYIISKIRYKQIYLFALMKQWAENIIHQFKHGIVQPTYGNTIRRWKQKKNKYNYITMCVVNVYKNRCIFKLAAHPPVGVHPELFSKKRMCVCMPICLFVYSIVFPHPCGQNGLCYKQPVCKK